MVIKETANDDLTQVMTELIETYGDQMADVAISLCRELVRKHFWSGCVPM